jgi:aryl-alcohol dehydrogenase-like predicted oxidoreductase
MDTVGLGRTQLQVTPIAYGTWQFGGEWGEVEERSAIESICHARELGINVFDTAQGYGFGTAERLLGRALAGEMDQVVIATKGGLRMDGDTLVRDSSPAWIRRGVEESLNALGIDHIDLYQIHWPDQRTPLAKTAAVLWDMVDEGLIDHVGVSNFDVDQLREFSAERQVEALQSPYHLFHRDIEGDTLPYAAERDLGVLAYGPLAHGLLGGGFDKYTTFPANDWRSGSPDFTGDTFHRNVEVVGELRRFAEERDATIGQLAVAWVLASPAVQVAIVGSRRRAHLEETVGALDIDLGKEALAQIDKIMSGAVPLRAPAPEGA